MTLLLGLLIFAFIVTSMAIVPFINVLYKIKFQRRKQKTKDAFGKNTPIFDKFHSHKEGTPVGGGLLIIGIVTLMFLILFPVVKNLGVFISNNYPSLDHMHIVFLTFISFGILGLYDDIMKMFGIKKSGFFGMRLKHKFAIQWILALIIGAMMYLNLGINFIYVPLIGEVFLSWLYIPFAAFVIVSFTNAVNITDGLDGLASGVLMVALFAFWVVSATILDTSLSMFLALWIGSLIAFLYFNVYPARIWMGDVGSLSFGATFAVIGLLMGKVSALIVIGALFILEVSTSVAQLLSKKYRGKKLFPAAPFHLYLQLKGWEEPKIVMRFWLAAVMLAILGVWMALIQN